MPKILFGVAGGYMCSKARQSWIRYFLYIVIVIIDIEHLRANVTLRSTAFRVVATES